MILRRPTRTFNEFFKHLKSLDFKPETIIDVGVADGTPALYEAFPDSYLILFEPMQVFENALKEIVAKYNGEYHLCGLMAKEEEAAIIKPNNLYGASLVNTVDESKFKNNEIEKVSIKTLDGVLSTTKELKAPYLLKIDCQGGDYEVVLGGKETLKLCEVVIMEVSLFKFRGENHPTPLEILNFMDSQGFVLYDFLDGLFRPLDKALGQIDFVFVKRDGMFRYRSQWADEDSKMIDYIDTDNQLILDLQQTLNNKNKQLSEKDWIINKKNEEITSLKNKDF